MIVFFFKQKTAYEMRISDWSSDVCSSDLPVTELPQPQPAGEMILAETTPYRAAPRVAGEGRIRPAQQPALELAKVLVPKAMGFAAKNPEGWAVQLGAYDSLAKIGRA